MHADATSFHTHAFVLSVLENPTPWSVVSVYKNIGKVMSLIRWPEVNVLLRRPMAVPNLTSNGIRFY